MKKVILFVLAACLIAHAQAQTSNIPYQLHFSAVARNPATHVPVTSVVDVRLEVWHSESSTSFTPDTFEYCEEIHNIPPNSFGEFSTTFGTSAAVICITGTTLSNTLWQHGNMWYIIKYDTAGGSFVPIDTGRFTSTTYAYAAHTAEQLINTGTSPATGSTLTWNGSAWAPATPTGVLPGTIQAWAGATAPAGYLFCDGGTVNSSSYPLLYNAIGTIWGNGTGAAGSFNLPDMRGVFVRGYDSTASNDPDHDGRTAAHTGGAIGNNVGSVQTDTFKAHNHNVITTSGQTLYGVYTRGYGDPHLNTFISDGNVEPQNFGNTQPYAETLRNSSLSNAGGNETRPKNVSVMYIIKY